MNKENIMNQLEKKEVEELIEFKELLETMNRKDFYKDIPNEDKRMYRSLLYVRELSHIIIMYCIFEDIEKEALHKSENHKAKLKKYLVDWTDEEVKDYIDVHVDGSFIWEEFLSEYDSIYDGLTMNQKEMDEMFGKGENKAPFLKVLDEVLDKAEEDGTLDEMGKKYVEDLIMKASDEALEEDGMTVEQFFGGKAS